LSKAISHRLNESHAQGHELLSGDLHTRTKPIR
jgi:hypothetical protein